MTRWLGKKAEELGVEIYPGFAASKVGDQWRCGSLHSQTAGSRSGSRLPAALATCNGAVQDKTRQLC